MSYLNDTIFAVAAGGGGAALTVLRISGTGAGPALEALTAGRIPVARRAALRRLRGADATVLDEALVLWFPGPHSFTGEDSAELHLHGGRAVLAAVAEALLALGLRPAEAGEFSRRAFLNGRMDLLAAEGVADLVAAETEAQRRQALRQVQGGLSALYQGWSDRLLRLLAQQEALIDFPDEDLPASVEAAARAEIAALQSEIAAHLDDGRRGERLREGLVFAIVGPPNAGKSTLMNALVQREVAIVSPIAGTTRDVLEARLDLGGVAVTLQDTAGLREAGDTIEAEGVRRARAVMRAADLVLLLRAGDVPEDGTIGDTGAPVLRVTTKADLMAEELAAGTDAGSLAVSARSGQGMDALRDALARAAREMLQLDGPPALTRPRHRAALQEAATRLAAAGDAGLAELRGEDLRLAVRALGRVTGAVGVEDVLDSIFRQFCIGK